jgi:hypothetical protein
LEETTFALVAQDANSGNAVSLQSAMTALTETTSADRTKRALARASALFKTPAFPALIKKIMRILKPNTFYIKVE